MARHLIHRLSDPPRWVLVAVVTIAASISVVSAVGLYGASQDNTRATNRLVVEIKGLLTSGHTTTAERTKHLESLVETLSQEAGNNTTILKGVRYLVTYVVTAQGKQGAAVDRLVRLIEAHIDQTITRDAARIEQDVLAWNRRHLLRR